MDWHTEPSEDGDPIFCDKPAPIKYNGVWLCAEHYDDVLSTAKQHRALDKYYEEA